MVLLAVVADEAEADAEDEDDDAADFSSPLPQAVRPTISREKNTGTQEFFLNRCVNFIKETLFLIN
jgi:hypothetical protein